MQWDIKQPPSQALVEKVERPCLAYERASILYTTIPAIENIARLADIVVFGDMFNYTGALYAYDEIFKKLGALSAVLQRGEAGAGEVLPRTFFSGCPRAAGNRPSQYQHFNRL